MSGTNKDTLVTCGTCHSERYVNFQTCLQLGWPSCCGYTMSMVMTNADVGRATTAAIGAQIPKMPA